MNKRDEFLKTQKILRLCTIDKNEFPHITPVWYAYSGKKIYIGTDTNSQKIKNLQKNNHVSFCVDVGVNSPDIYGVMGKGLAKIILEMPKTKIIAKKILLKYFKTLESKSAKKLLDDTDCIIEIIPEKFSVWNY
ncbi:MAG: pyridoxamine 5'-phosphate oxidase family protein [Nitrosopumilus sp.]|jgi:nitroimidazol reductase NimA-like FMN-containing flavoprotein (pyridoxamine 5'-phosphate oxidase superfamily)|nr:pyridoxamine 5'-phosphate oxidase family protein [Nitrosopumilus sp.]